MRKHRLGSQRQRSDAQLAASALADLESASARHTVDSTAPGNTALDIADYDSQSGTMPRVVRDFIRSTTDPNQGPLTYEEASPVLFQRLRPPVSRSERTGASWSMIEGCGFSPKPIKIGTFLSGMVAFWLGLGRRRERPTARVAVQPTYSTSDAGRIMPSPIP
jgi:hypothetical protein